MAAHYGIDISQVEFDLRKTLEQWRREGLANAPRGRRRRYKLAGITFSITYSDPTIEAVISPVFRHLEVSELQQPKDIESTEFLVEADGCEFMLLADGIELRRSPALDDILERLSSDIVIHSYDRIDWLMSVHAAALGDATSCILLPGASGTGKSTLAACLLARGKLRLLTDDIALLDRTTMNVQPVPGPLVLKRGSWDLISSFRDIELAPVYRRYGEEVRYLAPDRVQVVDRCLPVLAVVFAERGAATTETPRPITQLEGFQRLIAAPATVKGPISEETLARLIKWSTTIRFYHLPYARPEQAATAVEALLSV